MHAILAALTTAFIMQTCPCDEDPLTPNFIVKLGLTGVYIIFLFLLLNIDCGYFTTVNKNSAEVDIAPAFGEITTACHVGQAKKGPWCIKY